MSNVFADVSTKIIALADPILSQPDMEREMVSPPAGAYFTSFTIYHVLPDLPEKPPGCVGEVFQPQFSRRNPVSFFVLKSRPFLFPYIHTQFVLAN